LHESDVQEDGRKILARGCICCDKIDFGKSYEKEKRIKPKFEKIIGVIK